jgi:hypothetical protein
VVTLVGADPGFIQQQAEFASMQGFELLQKLSGSVRRTVIANDYFIVE